MHRQFRPIRLGVAGRNLSTFLRQLTDDFQRGRTAERAGVGFVRQAQYTNSPAFDRATEIPLKLANDQLVLLSVRDPGTVEQLRFDPEVVTKPPQRLQVAGQCSAGEAESGEQHRFCANPRLEAQDFRQTMTVRADEIAEVTELVREADRQGEEAIKRMLGHFRRSQTALLPLHVTRRVERFQGWEDRRIVTAKDWKWRLAVPGNRLAEPQILG